MTSVQAMPSAAAIEEVKRSQRNLTEEAYQWIRGGILSGSLPFGTRLSRRALAEELGISVVPVGDALQRLEADGLIESRPRVGTRVRIPTAKAVRGHFILREALETQSARLFAENAGPVEREDIARRAAELDAVYAALAAETEPMADRLFEVHKLHMDFHMRVAEYAGCPELRQAIEKNQVLVFNWLYDTVLGNQAPPPGWHSQLTVDLVSGNPEAADAAMRRHVRFRMEELLQRMEEPDSGWARTGSVSFRDALAARAQARASVSAAE